MILTIDGLSVRYGGEPVLQKVSVAVRDKEITAIVGANGAGKTSLLRAVVGMVRVIEGRITFKNTDITGMPLYERARRGLNLLPEGRELFAGLSVAENLTLGGESARGRATKRESQERLNLIYEYFPILGERRNQTASAMSGGEQQMLALGRLLMGFPEVLVLDEPSVGLAPRIVDEVADAIMKMRAELGVGVLIAEQNVRMAFRMADSIHALRLGNVVLSKRICDHDGSRSQETLSTIVGSIR